MARARTNPLAPTGLRIGGGVPNLRALFLDSGELIVAIERERSCDALQKSDALQRDSFFGGCDG
ncbi:MAG: hypothetical protein AAF416_09420 [Pseudomonadota bacterium]